MAKSIRVNYIYNLINTISGLLFPLISFPYASRVLMADGIGHINFYQSIIQYITMLSCLGIPMYAIREIAKVRDDIKKRNRTTIEILLLNASLTVFGYFCVVIVANTVEEVKTDIPLFLILSLTIFFTTIGCEWFYQGIEDFKYITIRGLFVRLFSLILLFIFVKTKEDLYWYAVYSVIGVLGGNVFNFIRLRRYISIRSIDFKKIHPLRHFLPALHIFMLTLITSVYLQLNTIMLGFMSNDTSVGLFTASSKLSHMLLGIGGALSVAMLPRMSNLIALGKVDEFKSKSEKAMKFIVAISLPITIGVIILAPSLIPLFSGDSYAPAIPTLQYLAPIILIISMSGVIGHQILYPMGKTNIVIFSTAIGAVVNVILNILLIPNLRQDGAAISTTIAELFVTGTMLLIGYRFISFKFLSRSYGCYILGAIIMTLVILFLDKAIDSPIFKLLTLSLVGGATYALVLWLMKEKLFLELVNGILKNNK